MVQDIDDMEASCVFHDNDGMLDQQEQCKICIVTVTKLGIVMQTAHSDLDFGICFMYYPGDLLRQTSPDLLSMKEIPDYIT